MHRMTLLAMVGVALLASGCVRGIRIPVAKPPVPPIKPPAFNPTAFKPVVPEMPVFRAAPLGGMNGYRPMTGYRPLVPVEPFPVGQPLAPRVGRLPGEMPLLPERPSFAGRPAAAEVNPVPAAEKPGAATASKHKDGHLDLPDDALRDLLQGKDDDDRDGKRRK